MGEWDFHTGFLQPMLFSLYLGSQKRKNDQNEWKEIKHHHEKEKKNLLVKGRPGQRPKYKRVIFKK